jgi:predicted permease
MQDIHYGLRMLGKNWKLAGIAAVSLALAMTLSVAALSIANGVLLSPPLASAPKQLLTIYTSTPSSEFDDVSYLDYKYYRDNNHSFSGVAALPNDISKARLGHRDREEMGTVEQISDNYFSVMGIQPILGQFFVPGEDEKKTSLAVLSYSCWKRWGADPRIIGETVRIGTNAFSVIGVAPKDFTGTVFGFEADVIINLGSNAVFSQDPQLLTGRDNRWLLLVGRLKPGVTPQLARADLLALSTQLAVAYPGTNKDRVAALTATTVLPPDARATARLISAVLMAIVMMVLLIACANVANLLLGLATGRKQEILIRSALGATRGRLIRQLLTESLILCSGGGLMGFVVASVALARFSRFNTSVPIMGTFDFATNFRTDGVVVALTLAVILIASLATGITPALYASEPNVAGALSGEAVVGGRRKGFVRNALVVVEIAICTLVIAGVGLCLRSLHNLREVNTGFSARNLAAVMINSEADASPKLRAQNFTSGLTRPRRNFTAWNHIRSRQSFR